jgi:putative ABC transport system ATP-binding protein
MDLLLKLNHEKGTTIVIVTHDPVVAGKAQRTIRLFDGKIVEEEKS